MMTGQHDLQQLNMGQAFAQGALGRLYRRTYNGDEVAVKILERPENNIEKEMMMESAFAKEVMMLEASECCTLCWGMLETSCLVHCN